MTADFQAMLIRTVEMTDARLTSSTVPETAPASYNGGTTYGLGDTVSVGSVGSPLLVYRSLQASNTGHTPSGSPLWWEELGTTYSTYSGATTYADGNIVIDATNHLVYESLQNSNTGHALTDDTWWLPLGGTNRWKMFDQSPESQTLQKGVLTLVFSLNVSADVLTFINATSVKDIRVQTSTGYDETIAMLDRVTPDYWSWMTEPFFYRADVSFYNIGASVGQTITVTITPNDGEEAGIGCCIPGKSKRIGYAQHGMSVGITDYSVKSTDTFGNTVVVQRGYSKRMEVPIVIDNDAQRVTDDLLRTFAEFRAVPVVWIMNDSYECSIVYGYYRDFSLVIAGPTHTTYQLSVEGLK